MSEYMDKAQQGDTVEVHYRGKLGNGELIDTSVGKRPLQVTLGQNIMLPALEEAIVGMEEGENKEITVPPERAYGEHRPDFVFTVSADQFPSKEKLHVGQTQSVRSADGVFLEATIVAVEGSQITLDANHPLAGEKLHYEVSLEEIA